MSDKKIEKLISSKIEENTNLRKKAKLILPIGFLLAIILISIDWSVMGWILLIGDLLFLGVVWVSPTDYDAVKKSVLEEIEQEKQEQLEKERAEKERAENIRKYGCAFQNTELIKDEFSETSIITTELFSKFRQSALTSVTGVNQSVQLFYNEFAMPSVNINIEQGMWASVRMEILRDVKKYFLEFHFRYETRTKDKGWSNKPSAENCVLDIMASGEKHSIKSNITQNDKEQYDYNVVESKMTTKQTFNFEMKPETLKLLTSGDLKIRLSNFSNMGEQGKNIYPIKGDFIPNLQGLVRDFCSDLNI